MVWRSLPKKRVAKVWAASSLRRSRSVRVALVAMQVVAGMVLAVAVAAEVAVAVWQKARRRRIRQAVSAPMAPLKVWASSKTK